jgi:hypothetical protein
VRRQHLAAIALWIVLICVGTMFGASVYQRIALIPEWGGDLPPSVIRYFGDRNAGRAIDRFWSAVTAPTAIAIVVALILNWPLVARRRWISRGAILFFLMLDEITRMARAWIFWDWFRIAGTLGSYLLFIKAASDPT